MKTRAADAKANAKAEAKTKTKGKEGEAASQNTGGDEDDEPLIASGKKTGSRAAANAGAAGTKDRNKKAAGEPKKDIQLKAPSKSAKTLGGESVALAKLVEAPAKTGRNTTGAKRSAMEAAPAEAPRKKRAAALVGSQAGPAGALASFRSTMAGGGFLPRL